MDVSIDHRLRVRFCPFLERLSGLLVKKGLVYHNRLSSRALGERGVTLSCKDRSLLTNPRIYGHT